MRENNIVTIKINKYTELVEEITKTKIENERLEKELSDLTTNVYKKLINDCKCYFDNLENSQTNEDLIKLELLKYFDNVNLHYSSLIMINDFKDLNFNNNGIDLNPKK